MLVRLSPPSVVGLAVGLVAALASTLLLAIPVASEAAGHRHATRWDCLAHYESTHRWAVNTGNGHYGGLQFSDPTWDGYGGEAYASTANHATRRQQITIAEKVLAGQGWGAWPTCSRKVGLR